MTTTDTAPLSAEELARTAWSAIVKEMGNGPFGFEAEEIIAAAIRQHSEGRATQAEAERDALREYVSVTEYWKLDPHDAKERAAYLQERLRAALSPAQPAQGGGIARELAEEAVALLKQATDSGMLPGTPWELRAFAVQARARRAGLLTTETEGSNG